MGLSVNPFTAITMSVVPNKNRFPYDIITSGVRDDYVMVWSKGQNFIIPICSRMKELTFFPKKKALWMKNSVFFSKVGS